MMSGILMSGGGAALPGFTTRMASYLVEKIQQSRDSTPPTSTLETPPPDQDVTRHVGPSTTPYLAHLAAQRTQTQRTAHLRPFRQLVGLVDQLVILNGQCDPTDLSTESPPAGPGGWGSAPGWSPALVAWMGASIAGQVSQCVCQLEVANLFAVLLHTHRALQLGGHESSRRT